MHMRPQNYSTLARTYLHFNVEDLKFTEEILVVLGLHDFLQRCSECVQLFRITLMEHELKSTWLLRGQLKDEIPCLVVFFLFLSVSPGRTFPVRPSIPSLDLRN